MKTQVWTSLEMVDAQVIIDEATEKKIAVRECVRQILIAHIERRKSACKKKSGSKDKAKKSQKRV